MASARTALLHHTRVGRFICACYRILRLRSGRRQLRNAVGLAALFCITVAFVASGPSLYGYASLFRLGMSYDRIHMSGLLVLFLQSFANDLDARR